VFFTFSSGRVFADVCLQPSAPDIFLDAAVIFGAGVMPNGKLGRMVLNAVRASDSIRDGRPKDRQTRCRSPRPFGG